VRARVFAPARLKADRLELRIGALEKEAFKRAADLAGIPVSTWVRERLRRAAIRELEEAAQPIPFLQNVTVG
jgi:uncharacterized protein (DUF1778 family)